MIANRINFSVLSIMSRNGKVLLTLMGAVLCAEAAFAYQQAQYATNPCKIEDAAKVITTGGGCKDVRTGREWSRNAISPERGGSFWTFTPAKNYCANLVEGGMTDWRLPTRDEMKAVSANGAGTFLDVFWAVDGSGGPPSESDFFKWSSTTITVKGQRKGEYAYVVALGAGIDSYQWWSTNGSSWTDVVCVR
jgi:hypothetical protein